MVVAEKDSLPRNDYFSLFYSLWGCAIYHGIFSRAGRSIRILFQGMADDGANSLSPYDYRWLWDDGVDLSPKKSVDADPSELMFSRPNFFKKCRSTRRDFVD
mgnify:CR=1 FL=1